MARYNQTDLKESDWATIGERLKAGESKRSLAREYGVSDMAIRYRYPGKDVAAKKLAHDLFEGTQSEKKAMKALINLKKTDLVSQRVALVLLQEMQEISDNILLGSKKGSDTFLRLASAANDRAHMVDFNSSPDEVRSVMALTTAANAAAEPALKLLAANKATLDNAIQKDIPVIEITSTSAIEAAKEYQRIMNNPGN